MGIPFRVAELDHVVLRCHDQARMLDFYSRVLGLPEERRLESIGLVQLRAGASLIDLVPAKTPPDPAGRNVDHFCLGVVVEDFAATVVYLRAQGGGDRGRAGNAVRGAGQRPFDLYSRSGGEHD